MTLEEKAGMFVIGDIPMVFRLSPMNPPAMAVFCMKKT